MSALYPSDPLIRELKGYTAKFLKYYNEGLPVTDSHPLLLHFEGCMENICYCGIKAHALLFGYLWDGSPWRWIAKTNGSDDFFDERYQIARVIESVNERKNLATTNGKFRLAIRHCLVRKCLHLPFEQLLTTKTAEKYYMLDSIFADEILLQILLSVIYQLSKIEFKLDLDNSSLLDFSWELPHVVNVELVPTVDLGMSMGFAFGKTIILNIPSNSVAYDCLDINVGDVVEAINGEYIKPAHHSNLNSLLKTNRCKPVTLTLIKAIHPRSDTCRVHPAMIKFYKEVNLDVEYVRESLTRDGERRKSYTRGIAALNGFKVTYLGNVLVGRNNDVKAIDKAYATYLWAAAAATAASVGDGHSALVSKMKHDVLFEVGELGVKFVDLQNNRMLEQHMFMEISACSGVILLPNSIAYIAGKGSYKQGQNRCYFFMATNPSIAISVLQLMGQGFRRTCYAV